MTIHDAIQSLFRTMLHDGETPAAIVGGPLDGLRFFTTEIDGRELLITEMGLLTPEQVSREG